MKRRSSEDGFNYGSLNDVSCYESLYRHTFPLVKKHVMNNSGAEEDAHDVFQETLLIFIEKIKQRLCAEVSFAVISSIVFSISKNVWFQRLRDVKKHADYLEENKWEVQDIYRRYNDDHELIFEERLTYMVDSICKLKEKHRDILSTSLSVKNCKEGAMQLKYSETYYRKMLHIARRQLHCMLKDNYLFQDI